MPKILLKDYVSWGIASLGVLAAVIFGVKIKQLEDNRQQIHNVATTIQQNYYFSNLPSEVKEKIGLIASGTGPGSFVIESK